MHLVRVIGGSGLHTGDPIRLDVVFCIENTGPSLARRCLLHPLFTKCSSETRCGREMKHENLRRIPVLESGSAQSAVETSDHVSVHDALTELDQYECIVPSGEGSKGCARKQNDTAHKEALQDDTRTEGSGCRFIAEKDEGKLNVCDGVIRAIPFA
jgi:hypothetical protein